MKLYKDEVVLDRGNDITCTVNLNGATIVSWRIYDEEQLYLNSLEKFDGRKPIKGGIPIVFPHFGSWKFGPRHGFARLRKWSVEKPPQYFCNGDVKAIFSLVDDEFTRSLWHYKFKILYELTLLEKELQFHVTIQNTSKNLPYSFNFLLHSYFKVSDVRALHITGLNWCYYSDITRDGNFYQDGREIVKIRDWTHRVYQCTPSEIIMRNCVTKKKIRLRKTNLPDIVLWNPWQFKGHGIDNFDVENHLNVICLQAGHVHKKIKLLPGEVYEAKQILQVRTLEGTYK